MFLDKLCCEARPSSEEPRIDCFDPGQRDWTERGFVEVDDDVTFFVKFIDVVGLERVCGV